MLDKVPALGAMMIGVNLVVVILKVPSAVEMTTVLL
jgi:hypothetical protein